MLRALVVDDEPIARRVLREDLIALGGVEIVGEAENGLLALNAIEADCPDLVFLDLQMPVMDGFSTIARLRGSCLPAVVILTAYDEFAIEAFDAGAIDYLLKPVSQDRLKRTVERVKRMLRDPGEVAQSLLRLHETAPPSPQTRVQKIVGKYKNEYFLLDINEILAFRADGDLTWILTADRRYLATQNLKTLAEKLAGSAFRRIHRNAIINLDQIQKMSMLTSQRWLVTLNNAQQFTVSKRLAKNLREVLNW